jgi:hypothetical protein
MAEPPRVLPQRQEGVLDDLDDDLGIVAAPEQPDVQPGSVPVVQLSQGTRFPLATAATSAASLTVGMPSLSQRGR